MIAQHRLCSASLKPDASAASVNLLSELSATNFRCFRRKTTIRFGAATYLIGVNNSGKTAILSAVQCFFDSAAYRSDFLNRAELAARRKGANRSIIEITFNLPAVRGKTFQKQLIQRYGQHLIVKKSFTTGEISREITISYGVSGHGETFRPEDLPSQIRKLLNSVSVSYIHPQEGTALLERAQAKLKTRLLQNWGRHVTVANRLKALQTSWDSLRKTANNYLSASLTSNVRKVWPKSSVNVDLPSKIQDIVAISDILFQDAKGLPAVPLTDQGSGAQSTILYHAHYLLDSDRTLHRGPYSPVWLLEEPESFLHADLEVKLGTLLNSSEWLGNIQMIISTHSAQILATSKANEGSIEWALVSDHGLKKSKLVRNWSFDEVKEIGNTMGDTNFDAYFYASGLGQRLFLEDSRALTKTRLTDAGFTVERALQGISEVRKYVDVFKTVHGLVRSKCFFLIDNDKGSNRLREIISGSPAATAEDLSLYKVSENVFVLLMPMNGAAEDLFDEFPAFVDACVGELFKGDLKPADTVPGYLSRAHAYVRGRATPSSREEARNMIKNQQDVKDRFWSEVDRNNYQIATRYRSAIETLMTQAT